MKLSRQCKAPGVVPGAFVCVCEAIAAERRQGGGRAAVELRRDGERLTLSRLAAANGRLVTSGGGDRLARYGWR